MNLYLLRHAEAEDCRTTDAARELTPLGEQQARTVGRFCAARSVRADLLLASPYRRAEATARLAREAAGWPEDVLQIAPFLASGMRPDAALEELRAYARFEHVFLVGHQPDFGMLAAALIGLPDAERLAVGKASLTCVRVRALRPGGGELRFSLPVKLMPPP